MFTTKMRSCDRSSVGVLMVMMVFWSPKCYMLNLFTAPACKISGLKSAHIHARKKVYLMVLLQNLLSILWILVEFRLRDHVKGEKGLSDFKFGTFVAYFQIDGAVSMAVKGLKLGHRYFSKMICSSCLLFRKTSYNDTWMLMCMPFLIK